MPYLDLAINLFLLFLWCRIWTEDENTFFFNPFISAPMRVVDRILGFFHHALPFLSNRVLAAIALLAALTIKTFIFLSPVRSAPLYVYIAHEVANFFVFTLQITCIYALLRLMSKPRLDRAGQVADLLTRPVGKISPVAYQLLLAPICMYLIHVIQHTLPMLSSIRSIIATGDILRPDNLRFLFYTPFVFSLTSFIGTLQVWSQCTLLAIVVSLVGLITPQSPVAACGRDFARLLLGHFSGLLVVGMMDLTPFLFFFALDWIHRHLMTLVAHLT